MPHPYTRTLQSRTTTSSVLLLLLRLQEAQMARVGGHYTILWSFKVTEFSIIQKPVCDFVLVNNTNLVLSFSVCQIVRYSAVFTKLSLLILVPLSNEFVFRNFPEYCRYSHTAKSRFFWTTFVTNSMGLYSISLT